MMKSFLFKARVGAIVALTLFGQSAFAAEHAGDAEVINRYKSKFPKFDTVIKSFTKWSEKENEGDIANLSQEEHKKQAEWAGNALWLRGKIDAVCKPASDPTSKEMGWMLDYCFGIAGEGQEPAAVYRLVVDGLKEKESDEVAMAMREVKACRAAFKDMFKWKRNKVKESKEFKSEFEMEKKVDNFLDNLEDKFDASEGEETEGEKKIAKHKAAFQSALKEMKVENFCRLNGDSSASPARDSDASLAKPSASTTPASGAPTSNAVWRDKNGYECKPPAEGCEKVAAAQAQPPTPLGGPTPYGAVQPPFSSPVVPNYGGFGGGGYDQCGFMGCGYGGGGNYGGGYVPSAAPANPGVLPPPTIFPPAPIGGGGGFSGGYNQGPRPVPPPPPPYPMPMGPMGPPVQFAPSGPTGGPDMPTVTKVETVTTVTKSTPTNSPIPMPMPMGFMNRCGKPVCSPAFGMAALSQRFPMMNPYMTGMPPINGFIPRNIPPSVTPYYPGTNPGSYGPITTTPVNPTNNPTSPYVNPTFYGTPNPQYQPIPSTRDRIGRIT